MARFPTAREIYARIRWDPAFDPAEFTIGYEARGGGLEEIAFGAFDPGEIPWHRLRTFRRGADVVWDRRRRLACLPSARRP